jgi:hypothetical protein
MVQPRHGRRPGYRWLGEDCSVLTDDDRYNTPTEFLVKASFPSDAVLTIRNVTENGVMFKGSAGRTCCHA